MVVPLNLSERIGAGIDPVYPSREVYHVGCPDPHVPGEWAAASPKWGYEQEFCSYVYNFRPGVPTVGTLG
jgi:hypothetical protein